MQCDNRHVSICERFLDPPSAHENNNNTSTHTRTQIHIHTLIFTSVLQPPVGISFRTGVTSYTQSYHHRSSNNEEIPQHRATNRILKSWCFNVSIRMYKPHLKLNFYASFKRTVF